MTDSVSISIPSRIRGSLFGVAVTDALGGPVEFCPRGTFAPVTEFRYNHNFDGPPGSWTDDTSMTLCLAQSLVDTQGKFVAQDQVRKYIRWRKQGYLSASGSCVDIGMATRIALGVWKHFFEERSTMDVLDPEGHVEGQALIDASLKREVRNAHSRISRLVLERGKSNAECYYQVQCGNGSLMRVAPIAAIYHSDPALALRNAALSSILTHPHPTNTEACQIYTHILTLIYSSSPKEELARALTNYPFASPKLRLQFAKYNSDLASFAAVDADDIQSSGYVVHTLDAALWAFLTTDDFRQGALKAVNLGHDADTVGAVYGGAAGAFYGVENVPKEWIEGLVQRELVEDVIEGVVRLVERGGY
ncbi:hypothetical protein MMC07_006085 [Pseudocyphellaria aurata]|nr:hypothetical protein [Pseudocyphellaria aurata]